MLFPENVKVVAVGFGVSVEDSVSSRPALPVELAPTSGAECHQMADGWQSMLVSCAVVTGTLTTT